MKRLVYSLAATLAACGGPTREADPDGVTVDAAPTCAPAQSTTTFMVPTVMNGGSTNYATWSPLAVAGPQAMLASQLDGTGAIQVALITPDAPVSLATFADAAGYTFAAAVVPGSQCAIVSSGKTGLALACPGAALDVASNVQALSGAPVFPVQTASSLFVYTQTFASFTELEHASTGGWQEHQQNESSVSFPTDAALAGGSPIACFISDAGYAEIAYGEARAVSTASAHWCKLAVAGDTVHALTDAGYGTVSLASLHGEQNTLTLTPVSLPVAPQQLVMVGATPHALVDSSDGIQLVPMPSGTTISLPGATGDSAQISWDPARGALTEVSYNLDTSGAGPMYPETVYFETRCAP